jgi:hypothetical protein
MKGERRLFTPAALGSWPWTLVRLPIYFVLLICEPMLRIGFTTIALLGLVTAVVLKFSGSAEHFPFWRAVLFFGCCGLLPMLHRAALRLFTP